VLKRTSHIVCLVLCLALARSAAADPMLTAPPERQSQLKRKIGIGLLIGSGVSLALGLLFVGLAKSANDSALANNMYDPSAEDRRNGFQVTQVVFFTLSATSFVSGMVLFWDR
jgi:hypothetical protein